MIEAPPIVALKPSRLRRVIDPCWSSFDELLIFAPLRDEEGDQNSSSHIVSQKSYADPGTTLEDCACENSAELADHAIVPQQERLGSV